MYDNACTLSLHRYDVEFERAYLEKMRSKLGLVQKQLPDDRSVRVHSCQFQV